MMSRTSIAWMLWLVPQNQSPRARMVAVIHAAVEAIAIATVVAGVAVVAREVEAIAEATAVTVAAMAVVVVDAEDDRGMSCRDGARSVSSCQKLVGRSDAALFI